MLVQYVRDKNGNPVGCVVATSCNMVGWSMLRKGDTFNKDMAKRIASGRAVVGTQAVPPSRIVGIIENMNSRSIKYFK